MDIYVAQLSVVVLIDYVTPATNEFLFHKDRGIWEIPDFFLNCIKSMRGIRLAWFKTYKRQKEGFVREKNLIRGVWNKFMAWNNIICRTTNWPISFILNGTCLNKLSWMNYKCEHLFCSSRSKTSSINKHIFLNKYQTCLKI